VKVFIFIMVCIFCSSALSASEYTGKVKGFYINTGKTVLIKFDINTPACSDTSWPFSFNMDGPVAKEWVSMILMARAADKEIKIGYIPNSGGRCSVSYFYFY
jgi:hypothetical protein